MNNLKKRCLTLLLSLAMIITYMPVSMITAYAAAGDTPAHDKILTQNKDGTYTIALNVTGDSEKKPQKVNVIVIVDRSGSMNTQSGTGSYVPSNQNGTNMYGLVDGEYVRLTRVDHGYWANPRYTYTYNGTDYTGQRYQYDATATRLQATQGALSNLADSLLSYNGKDDNPDDTVEMSLVQFATSASTVVSSTTSASTYNASVAGLTVATGNAAGTNWEAALKQADTISFGDNDRTFVIFFSDGAPTFYGNTQGSGYEEEPNMSNSYNAATDDAAALATKVGPENFYTIFAYGTSAGQTYMTNLTAAAGAPAGNNYSASSTAELKDAFDAILESIEMSGIGNVSMTDGTTSSVTTTSGEVSHLLTVDTDSYKYYRAGGTAASGTGEKYDSSANGGLGEEWADAPTANFEDGAVKWDLSSEGVLENGVTYTVTFDCWPSQTTLDIVADIKNDPSSYDSLDANIKKYIDENGNLKTNTTATLDYTDTRTGQSGSETYENPDPVQTTAVEQLAISKEWENELDGQQAAPVTLTVTSDGKPHHTMTLSDPTWSSSTYISIGILRTGTDGSVEVLETGHDFTFTEPEDLAYYWELDVPTIRPMLVNGTLTMLILKEGKYNNPDGAAEYTIDGKTYYAGDTGAASLTATNNRRARLNLTKVVDGEDSDPDQTFPFTLNVVDSKASTGSEDDLNSDYYVWFSVYKEGEGFVDAVVSGAEKEIGEDGQWTGYYYAPSGTNIAVNLREGDGLRFLNLPTDSTYTFTEGTIPDNYAFTKSELTAGTDTTFSGAQTTTGTIQATNEDYQVTYTNTYDLADVEITKVWEDAGNQDGTRPSADAFKSYLKLFAGRTDVTAANASKLTVTDNGDNTYTAKWTGLDRYAGGNEIAYTVEENEIPGYTTTGSPAQDKGTITNSHTPSLIDIPVKKIWDDADNQDGIRPGSVTVNLLADGQAAEGVDPITLNAGNNWSGTFTDLPENKNGVAIAYTIQEASVPTDYTVTYGTDTDGKTLTVTNKHEPEMRGYLVSKTWDDANDQDGKRPESIEVNLTKNGSVYKTVTLNAENDWQYAWVNELPKYENGTAISYSAEEVTPEGSDHLDNYNAPTYQHTGSGADRTATAITNSRGVDKTTYTIKKVWDDNNNQDGIRPGSVTVQLYADGKAYGDPVELNAEDNDWQYTWEDLPLNREISASETGNTSSDSDNSQAAAENSDEEAAANAEAVAGDTSEVADAEEETTAGEVAEEPAAAEEEAAEEPAKEEAGSNDAAVKASDEDRAIKYTAEEDPVPDGYEASYGKDPEDESVNVVTNKHVPETQDLDVTKIWDDDSNRDGIRPAGVTFTVTGSDGNTYTATLEKPEGDTVNEWTATIQNVAKYYNEGTAVTFTVDEDDVDNYQKEIDNENLTITNSHTPAKKNIDVEKIWNDKNDQDGKRPAQIIVQLIGKIGDTVVSTVEKILNKDNDWKATFTDVLVNYNGQPISYIINEIVDKATTDEYTSSGGDWTAAGEDHEREFTTENGAAVVPGEEGENDHASIENTHETEKKKITVTKIWDDNSDMDGKRPDSVKFTVTGSDGKKYETTLSGEGNTWTSEIEVEALYDQGKEVTFEVDEENVANYTKSIDNDTLTITNTRDAGHLEVTKTVVSDKAADKDLEFSFTVTLDDTSINGTFGDMTFENGVATFTLKHGETKTATGIPEGVGYVVTEEAEGFTVEKTGDEGTIGKGTTSVASFTNSREKGSLEVKKTVDSKLAADANKEFEFTVTLDDDSIKGTYGEMTFTNGVATFKLKGGESKTATGLPTTVGYTVTEAEAEGFTTEPAEAAEGTITTTASIEEFVNTREVGDLEVTKTVESDLAADADEEFEFTVTLSDTSISGEFGDMAFTNGVATFTLKDGQTATAEGLPTTVGYTVTETEKEGFELTEKTGDTGTISTETSTAAFTNTRETGDLYIYKYLVSDLAADADIDFNFTLTLGDDTISGTYGDVEFTDGVATFALKGGEDVTVEGLPSTLTYTLVEEDADGFTTEYVNPTGTIAAHATGEAGANNTRVTGDLEVKKTVESELAADANASFEFTVTLDDNTITGTYGDMTFTDGVATFTLKGGESKTATGLPTTVGYTVEETAADGFTTTSTGETGDITVEKSVAEFTNTRKTGDLKVTKTVDSDKTADKSIEFEFTVTLGDNTINGTYGDMEFTDGVATFTLKHEETKTATGLPDTVTYTVSETPVEGLAATYDSNSGAIAADETAESNFTNTRATSGLTVTKTVDSKLAADADKEFEFTVTLGEPINGTYGDMEFTNGVAEFTLKGGESKTATGLPTSISYTVDEAEADGFITGSTDESGTITADAAAIAAFTNTREVGDLTVSKRVVSDKAADKDVAFTFTVTLSDKTISGSFGDMTFTDGVATFTLEDGESLTATGLPTTVGYTVEETAAEGFTTEPAEAATGTITTTASSEEFVNTREVGNLEVTKTVVSDLAADADEEFEFTVTLDDESIDGVYGGMTFTNGVATFTLTSGETKTAEDLPTTVGYTVTETEKEGFELTEKTGDTGTISTETSTAAFTNTRETGDLYIYKYLVSDLAADADIDFNFTLTLGDDTISGTYGDVEFTNGVATFTLKGGEDVTVEGLPSTLTYTLVEEDADGFTTEYVNPTGTIAAHATGEARANNTRETGNLVVTKTVDSPQPLDNNVEFEFTVTLSDTTISGTYGGMAFTNGVATFTLKHGETMTATGLPTTVGYTVTETAVEGFTTTATGATGTISKDEDATAAFTNKAETTKITANKVWDDAEDQDGYRPEELTFTLTGTAGETEVYSNTQTVEVADTAEGAATATWENLTTHYNGTEIEYVVTEATVDEYTTEVGDLVPNEDGSGYTVEVTNTHVPATTEVTVVKIWNDNSDYDKLRPEGIGVHLAAKVGDSETDATLPDSIQKDVTLTKTANVDPQDPNKWTYTWSGLPLREDGTAIKYTVSEDPVNGYHEPSIVGPINTETTAGDPDTTVYKIEITNTLLDVYKEAKTPELKILKKDQDGVAMEGVTFTLTNPDNGATLTDATDGDGIAEIDIPASDEWLPVDERDEGKKTEYNFTLTETPVAGYEKIGPWNVKITLKKIDGENTYKYEIVDVEGEDGTKSKAWTRFIEWIISGLTGQPAAAYDWDGENVYLTVTNKAAKQSVQVTKTFAGIDALPEGFQIDATYVPYGAVKNEEGKIPTKTEPLTAANATVSGNTLTWTLDDVRFGSEVVAVETGYEDDFYVVDNTYTTKIKGGEATAPAQGTTATIAKVPAGAEEGEIVGNIDFTNTYECHEVVITKALPTIVDHEGKTSSNGTETAAAASFAFHVIGYDAAGTPILDTVAGIDLSKPGQGEAKLGKISGKVVRIEVTEVYAGNYSAKGDNPQATATLIDDPENEYMKYFQVDFENQWTGDVEYKTGITNQYSKTGDGTAVRGDTQGGNGER